MTLFMSEFLKRSNIAPEALHNREVAENCALYWSRDDGELASLIDKADFMSADEITEMGEPGNA